jgi:hypothetical protein
MATGSGPWLSVVVWPGTAHPHKPATARESRPRERKKNSSDRTEGTEVLPEKRTAGPVKDRLSTLDGPECAAEECRVAVLAVTIMQAAGRVRYRFEPVGGYVL